MRVLLLAHAFNSLAQRFWVELEALGHEVSLELDVNDRLTEEAVELFRPDLVLAPFLRRAIPASVWSRLPCLVVHPGIVGDRGPSALDWAIQEGEREWGVTLLQANAEMDAGDVWASAAFPMREVTKSSLYRNEVTEAAVRALHEALAHARDPAFRPLPLASFGAAARGRLRPPMRQPDRAIDWSREPTARVLAKLRAADGTPGVLDTLCGAPVYLFDASPEAGLGGPPGALLARRDGAILRATADGAVWIGHLARATAAGRDLKLPAVEVLGPAVDRLPELDIALDAPDDHPTRRDIRYEEDGPVGWLHFPFYNGAMGTDQCLRLARAWRHARGRPTRVIVLAGGPDFWSNGIHLGLIEAADGPADASMRNIEAMDDLALEILTTTDRLTVSALCGNAGAGGVFLALAADQVWAREGVVLNPHYRSMGNLYGSEYWTYLLPRRVGARRAGEITGNRLPVDTRRALEWGLIDARFAAGLDEFRAGVARRARALAEDPALPARLARKAACRASDEADRPLAAYRADELERMRLNFYGFDPSYHVARHNFVRRVPKSRTPLYLARHRARAAPRRSAL